MAAVGDDGVLVKIAIFGFAMSLIATALFTVLLVDTGGDYSYDEINAYRDELIGFSGDSMINETPWVLSHVYTPWNDSYPAVDSTDPSLDHIDDDGWLYGEDKTTAYLNTLDSKIHVKLDPNYKSSTMLDYHDETYKAFKGFKSWSRASGTISGTIFGWLGLDTYYANLTNQDIRVYGDETAHSWNFTGYRYVFDPTLPFSEDTGRIVDGSLSIVWYNFNNQEGLSGGLVITDGDILIANYSATDIIADYNTTSGYATVYDFNFGGVVLTLSIRFDQNAIEEGMSMMQAWTTGNWEMAISSPSAGSFFDIEHSSSFTVTAGNMIQTFMKIYKMDMPEIDNAWVKVVIWMLTGLPMTMAMLLITLRLINGFRVL